MPKRTILRMTLLTFALISYARAAESLRQLDPADWSRFRGPGGTGVSNVKSIPVTWTDRDYNWKIELPDVGHCSPVVCGNRIFLTCGNMESAARTVLCLDTADGRTLWRRDYPSKTYKQHRDNGYATETPTADKLGVVLAWTTPEQTVLLALDNTASPRTARWLCWRLPSSTKFSPGCRWVSRATPHQRFPAARCIYEPAHTYFRSEVRRHDRQE